MTITDIIKNSLKEAMREACDLMYHFSGDRTLALDCEYLLTVSIVTRLKRDLVISQGAPYKIRLEQKTRRFASACVPLFKRRDAAGSLPKPVMRKIKNTSRNGKIDIAVYDDAPMPAPICAIEVKGFNPTRSGVLADLRRNLECLRLVDETGGSRLQGTYFAGLHSFTKTYSEPDCARDRMGLKKKYEKWLTELGDLTDLDAKVLVFTVDFNADVDESPYDEGTHSEAIFNHFVGVIVDLSPAARSNAASTSTL